MDRFFASFYYALRGISTAYVSEINFRIEIIITALVLILAYLFRISSTEVALCVFAIGLVIAAELFNTALEKLADIVTKEHHPAIGIVKDVSAAAVLIACLVAGVVGIVIFTPYFAAFLA